MTFTLDTTPPAVSFDLDPSTDSAPVGDQQTTFSTVILTGQTGPFDPVTLVETGATTTADASGKFSFAEMPLHGRRESLPCSGHRQGRQRERGGEHLRKREIREVPSKTPAAQRQGPAQGDFPSAFGKSHNPVVKPDNDLASYPFHGSGQAYFPQQTVPEPYSPHPSPEPAPDPKALTGDPAGDYNRCLETSQSEAEARLQNRYKEINRLTCANLEDHRNPNAKLMLRLDGKNNFLAMLTRDHRVAVPALDWPGPCRLAQAAGGCIQVSPWHGKDQASEAIRSRSAAAAGQRIADFGTPQKLTPTQAVISGISFTR